MAAANASAKSEMLPASVASQVFRGGGGGTDRASGQSVDMEVEKGFSFSSQRCTCCPYGYHIDLDFLHYLDSLYSTEKLKTLKRFRRRGSPLLSPGHSPFAGNHEHSRETENIVLISDGEAMSPTEVFAEIDISSLVGTTNSASVVSGKDLRPKQENRLNSEPQTDAASPTISGSLVSEVSIKDSRIYKGESIKHDEHRTLVIGVEPDALDGSQTVKKSEVKLSLAAVSSEPCSATESSSQLLGNVLDADGGSVSPAVLQAIREQMMASLRRMKELEEQVKVIPVLQARISMLKDENRLLFVNADRTFCDVAVGDASLEGDLQSSPQIVATQPDSLPVMINGENNRHFATADSSQISFLDSEQSSDSLPVESRTVGVVDLRNLSATFVYNSEAQTVETGVNTEVTMEPESETRSIGVLCKASMKDISVGSNTTFVDAGMGDQYISGSSQDKFVQHLESETTLRDIEYRELSQSCNMRRDYLVSSHSEISESHRRDLDVSEAEYSGRFRSIGVQCGNGVVPSGNGDMEKLDYPQVDLDDHTVPIKIDRGTETDCLLFSEQILVSAERKKSAVEDTQTNMNKVEIKTQSESPVTSLTRNLASVSESQNVRELGGEPVSFDHNTAVEVQRQEFSMEVASHSFSSTGETTESAGKHLLGTEAVEGFVYEQTLESPRCGVPVIIDDSSESTSATASDSEDGSTLSVIEVTQRNGAGFQKAVRSVDEYFVSEESDERLLAGIGLTRTDSEEVVTSESKLTVVGSSTFTTQNTNVLEEKYKDFKMLDKKEEFVKNTSVPVEATAASFFILACPETATVEDHSGKSEGPKIDDIRFISTVESDAFVTTGERVKPSEGVPERGSAETSTVWRDGEQTVFLISSGVDSTGFSSPVTDHVEFLLTVKKRATCVVDVGGIPTESNIPSPAEDSTSRPTRETQKPMDEIPGSFPVVDLTSCGEDMTSQNLSAINGVETSSTATYRRIVITETKIERRRINEKDHDDMNLLDMPPDVKSDVDISDDDVFQCESRSEKSSQDETEIESKVLCSSKTTISRVEGDSDQPECNAASETLEDRTSEGKTKEEEEEEEEEEERKRQKVSAVASYEQSPAVGTEAFTAVVQSSSAADVYNIPPSADKEEKFDGGIGDALALCDQWLLSPEGTDIDKMTMFDLIRKHWFLISSRKSSSPAEVKDFLSLAQTYSSQLFATLVNMADADGNTALHYAVSYGNTDVLRLLLDTGACDVNRQNKAGYTAVMLAALLLVDMERYQSIIRRLFEAGDVNVPSTLSGQTALMLAASHGRNQMVMLLMDCGANVNAQDEDGSTALMCASEHGHIDIIKTLLSHESCDSLLTDVDGSTALSIAMEEGYQEIGVLLYAHMKAAKGTILEEDEEVEQD